MNLRARLYERSSSVVLFLAALALALARCAASSATSGPAASASTATASAGAAQRYSTVGRVRSVPPGRAFVSIAHQDVPGFMQAMTMDFEPTRPGQLDGLHVGDAVQFTFTQTTDRRLLLESIARIDEGR